MNQNVFSYTYCAEENREVLAIRKKYLPPEENPLEELKRLDTLVQNAGTLESLCAGIGGALLLGLGMCLSMEIIGQISWLGIPLGLSGIIGMLSAYPVRRRVFARARSRYTPRILELSEKLCNPITNKQ